MFCESRRAKIKIVAEPKKRVIKLRYLLSKKSRTIPKKLIARSVHEQMVIKLWSSGELETSKTRKAPFFRCQRYQAVSSRQAIKIIMKIRM